MSGIGNTAPSNTKAVELIHSDPTYSGGHFYPPADNTYDLGSATHSWRNIYVDTIYYGQTGTAEIRIGDADDYFKIKAVSNVPTIYGVGAYSRFGDAGTATHVDHEDDVLVSGELEVDGILWVDANIQFASATIPAGTTCHIGRDTDGLELNTVSGKVISLSVAGTVEYIFSSTDLNMNANTLSNIGNAGNDFGASQLDLQASFTILGANALAINTTAGDLNFNPAASFNVTLTDDDADAFDLANSAPVSYYLISTLNTAAGTIAHTFDTEDAVIASGTTNVYSLATFPAYTLTYTTTTAVTSLISSVIFGSTTITHASALNVTKATTIQVAPPIEGTLTLASASAIRILDAGSGTPTVQCGLYIEALTAGTTDYAIYTNAGLVYLGDAVTIIGAVTVGIAGVGHDVLFYSDTSGSHMLWDSTTDMRLELTNSSIEILTTGDKTAAFNAVYAYIDTGGATGWTSGNVVAGRFKVKVDHTAGTVAGLTAGWFGMEMDTGYAATQTGLRAVVNIEAVSVVANAPTALLYLQSLPGVGADFSAMPYIVFSETAGGTGSNILFEVGSEPAGTTCTTGTGTLYYNNTLQIKVNTAARYIPLSTAEGMYAVGAGVEGLSAFTYGTLASPLSIVVDTTSVQTPLIVHMNTTTDGTGMTCAAIFGNKAITDNQLRSVRGITTWADFSVNVKCAHGIIANITRTGNVTTENNDSACGFFDMDMGSSTTQCAGRLFAGYFEFSATANTTANPSSNYSTALMAVSYAMSNSVMYLLHQTTTEVEEAVLHIEATAGPAVPKGIFLEETGAGAYTCAIYAEGGYVYFNDILFIGDSNVANTKMTGTGITIDNAADYNAEYIALKQASVIHGMTTLVETDTFSVLKQWAGNTGGLAIQGYTEATIGVGILARGTTDVTTKATNSTAYVIIQGSLKDDSSAGAAGANANLLAIRNHTTVKFIFDTDGDFHTTDVVCGFGEGGVTALTGGEIRAPNLITGAGDDNVAGCNLTISPGLGRGVHGSGGTHGKVIINGAVDAAIDTVQTLTACMTLQGTNVGIGTATWGGSAAKNLSIGLGTEPDAHTDDQIDLYAKDSTDAGTTLGIYTEQAVEADGGFTASHKLRVWINGTEYWITLDAV